MDTPDTSSNSLETEFRIFLSVDIIDSSLHKKVITSNEYGWYTQFKDFFSFFITNIRPSPETLQIWKFLGDEIVFTSKLDKYADVLTYTNDFQKALVTFNKENKNPMRCKGTIWLANFPVYNMRIKPISTVEFDYIGPSIDAGFRLSSFSSERKLVLSVDAAYSLHEALKNQRHDDPSEIKFSTHCEGAHCLKGVYNNELYPVFWIDNYPENHKHKTIDELTLHTEWETEKIITYCREYIKYRDSVCIPFFTKEDIESHKPKNYDDRLQKAEEAMKGVEEDTEEKDMDSTKSQEDVKGNKTAPNFIS